MTPRKSNYGFYCAWCKEFAYEGYDDRDVDVEKGEAVCTVCIAKKPYKSVGPMELDYHITNKKDDHDSNQS